MNATGYGNIMKLMKQFYLDNTAHGWAPQLTFNNLKDYNEGLIALTGGTEGTIGRLLLENRKEAFLAELEFFLHSDKEGRPLVRIAECGEASVQTVVSLYSDLTPLQSRQVSGMPKLVQKKTCRCSGDSYHSSFQIYFIIFILLLQYHSNYFLCIYRSNLL
jgi:hypothetical protein